MNIYMGIEDLSPNAFHHEGLKMVDEEGSDRVPRELLLELAHYYNTVCRSTYRSVYENTLYEGFSDQYVFFEERIESMFMRIVHDEIIMLREQSAGSFSGLSDMKDFYLEDLPEIIDTYLYFGGVMSEFDLKYPYAQLFFLRLAYGHLLYFSENYRSPKYFEMQKEMGYELNGNLIFSLEERLYRGLGGNDPIIGSEKT